MERVGEILPAVQQQQTKISDNLKTARDRITRINARMEYVAWAIGTGHKTKRKAVRHPKTDA